MIFHFLYADDTTQYETDPSIRVIQNRLQTAIADLTLWCRMNGMVINIDKTKAMLITTRQKRNTLEDSFQVFLNDLPLSVVSNEKILGVQVDDNLTWTDHISKVCRKMSSNVWLLSKIRPYLSQEHRVLFYKSYIQPHIDYANIIWGNAAKTSLLHIERLQRRACRVILNYNVDSIQPAMNALKIMPFSERLFLRKAKLMFKVSNNITPDYINSMFSKRQPMICDGNESQVLRSMSADNFVIPKPNKELFKSSLAYSGTIVWNCLTKEVKMAPSMEAFHSRCLKWMKS